MNNPIWAIMQKRDVDGEITELLKSVPAFNGLTNGELITLQRSLHKRTYKSDERIFGENMPGAAMYIVLSGKVSIRKMIDGKDIELITVEQPSFFGEIALVDELPRSATAIALNQTELLSFGKPDLENIISRNPRLASKISLNIAKLLSSRLINSNSIIENLEIEIGKLKGNLTSEI